MHHKEENFEERVKEKECDQGKEIISEEADVASYSHSSQSGYFHISESKFNEPDSSHGGSSDTWRLIKYYFMYPNYSLIG